MVDLEAATARVFAWSPTLRRWADGLDPRWREHALTLARGQPLSPGIPETHSGAAGLSSSLRALRREALLTAAVAEQVAGDVTASFPWLTACAEAWVRAAFEHAFRGVCRRHGADPDEVRLACPWAVIALGKLGACEMNPSSDVDLLVAYAVDGTLPGTGSRTFHDLHDTVAREAAALLSENTAEGFCLRVDYDLRPEGRAGALTNSLDALVAYYEQYGSPLDRMAWTRARPVAGDAGFGSRVVASLDAFVYPRIAVSGALPALAGVLGRLRGSARSGPGGFNVKLGRGGIRDVELVVAAHQLILGGRRPVLRTPRTLDALARLADVGAMSGPEAGALARAYRFLRRLEHLVQYREDRRTHDVPLQGPQAEALAAVVGPGLDVPGLRGLLDRHREAVTLPADRLFGLRDDGDGDDPSAVATVLDGGRDDPEREAAARALGFGDVDAVLALLDRMKTAPASPLHPRNEDRFPGLDRRIVGLAARSVWPDGAVTFLARLARSPAHRPLFEMSRDEPSVLERLAEVGARSVVAADLLARDARAALEQALTGFEGAWPDPSDVRTEALEVVQRADPEEVGEALALFRRRHVLSVALRDLATPDAEAEVGASLTGVADACVEAALRASLGGEPVGLAVLGLGRLGGREMGYRSDLDLVFVHEGPAERVLPALHRTLHLLTTRTTAGAMLTLDLRLRPSGSQGPLLVESSEMARYYAEEAGGAECLGALNFRVAAGDRGLGRDVVDRVRATAASRLRDRALVEDLLRVRGLQHSGVAARSRTAYDPKLEAGGMLDIETAARLHALDLGAPVPTGTLAVLKALREGGGRFVADFAALERAYRFLWRLSNRAHLVLDRAVQDVFPDGPGAERLARVFGFEASRDGGTAAAGLWEAVRAALAEGTRVCGRLLFALGYGPVRKE